MAAASLDHRVLTVMDEAATRRFYVEGLGIRFVTFEGGRHALAFGSQKINVHYADRIGPLVAGRPTPGSADLCFLIDEPLAAAARRLRALGHPVIEGPVRRTGATGAIESIYVRDPDGNLVELAVPVDGA